MEEILIFGKTPGFQEASPRVTTLQGRNLVTRVAELIDPITNGWDKDLVCQTFNAEDAKIILQIPIYEHTKDCVAWHFDKKGIFSVKSAYKVAVDCAERESRYGQPSSSASIGETTNFEWKKIWALPLPNKILHFLWLMATYSLPLRMKLRNRGMEVDTRCPVCKRYDEDGGHCFLKCKKVRRLWWLAQMEEIREKLLKISDAISMFDEIFRLTEEDRMKVCILFWVWWHERNKANAGDHMKSLDDIIASINYHVFECMNLKKRSST